MHEITWRILTIGNLSRNRFWGEGDEAALRPALCTSTLIQAGGIRILIDPSQEPKEAAATLDRRAGITPKDIDIIFITHHHGDHAVGLSAYPNATIRMPEPELRKMENFSASPIADGEEIIPGLGVVSLPGHTFDLCGVVFRAAEGRILIAGDAVMTRDFFAARAGYFNSVDFAACSATHDKIAALADIIVPGHDNYFLTASVS